MKLFNKTFLTITILFAHAACAQSATYTSIASGGKVVYAGVKDVKKGFEPVNYLVEIKTDKMTQSKISLPTEINNREIIALLPAEKNQLVVLSQETQEQGDHPQFHVYSHANKQWRKITEVPCKSFAKVKLEKNFVSFYCSENDKDGKEKITEKKVELKGVALEKQGEFSLPMTKIDLGAMKAEFVGEPFEWKELHVTQGKNVNKFTP